MDTHGGPWAASGEVKVLTNDMQNEHITYAAIYSGGYTTLYKTIDGGGTWNSVHQFSSSEVVNALAVSGTTLYAGLSNVSDTANAIYLSTNSGTDWNPVHSANGTTTVNMLAIKPGVTTTAFAALSAGANGVILKTTDGVTWSPKWSQTGSMLEVAINTNNPIQILAGFTTPAEDVADTRIYLSGDGGEIWGETPVFTSTEYLEKFIFIHPTTSLAYIVTRPAGGPPPLSAHLWRSDAEYDSWTTITTGYLINLVFAPPDSIYSLYDAIAVTHDASATTPTWESRSSAFCTGGWLGWLISAAVDTSGTEDIIYVGASIGGMYLSTDDANSFHQTNSGVLSLLSPTELVTDPQEDDTLYAATSVGAYKTTDGGLNWVSIFGPIDARDLSVDPVNSSNVLLAGDECNLTDSDQKPSIYRTEKEGPTGRRSLPYPL